VMILRLSYLLIAGVPAWSKDIYASAGYLKGDRKNEKKYFDFVTANEGKLDVDEKVLWERVKKRLEQ
jgi:hypothetical protein